MKNLKTPFMVISLIISQLVSSCNNKNAETAVDKSLFKDYAQADTIATSPKTESTISKNRKFIRTADLKFRVKNVQKSTLQIEDFTGKYGGFVTYTNLQSHISNKDLTQISADSILEVSTLTIENDLMIRVPNQHLDSLLRNLNQVINQIDYRIIKADDVSLQMLTNQLKIKRLNNYDKRFQQVTDKRKGNIIAGSFAENNNLDHQFEADDSQVQNLSLEDQVNFSTINIHLYEREQLRKEMVENPKSIQAYKPNIFFRVWDSIKDGWVILEELIVVLFKFWAVFLIGFVGFWLYRREKAQHSKV